MPEPGKSKIGLTPTHIALLYVFISLVWVVISSELVLREFQHPVTITTLEIIKGVSFVLATGGLIFVICKRALDRMIRQKERLRESEKQRHELHEQLIQAQKLEGIGRLAGGVAHDFNNILTVILSSCHLLRRDVSSNGGESRLQMIETASDRAASLTRQLLAFSRHQVLEVQSLNPNTVIEETARLLERLLGEDVKLLLTLDPKLGNVLADPTQITQILMNLAVNARDAMPRGGTLEIHTQNIDNNDLLGEVPQLTPGRKVVLSVRDTGEGISEAIRDKIFEPFFTTKPAGREPVSDSRRSMASSNKAVAQSICAALPDKAPRFASICRAPTRLWPAKNAPSPCLVAAARPFWWSTMMSWFCAQSAPT